MSACRSVSATTLQQDFSSYESKYPDQDQPTQGPSTLNELEPVHKVSVTSIETGSYEGRAASVVPHGLAKAQAARPAEVNVEEHVILHTS